ncbi:hypothetical protein [Streptomyces sp. 147326]|uniref:hypothetical protein n=1 Tax=Streptomyces sp. 147326 TaxID=3074379 RepID=UPI003857C8CC
MSAAITRDWDRAGKARESFAAIAARALAEGFGRHSISRADVAHWGLTADNLPYQARLDHTFGQPPLTLFWNGEFHIDALFWLDSSTAVHSHSFSGAFGVLAGRSLHTRHVFTQQRRFSPHFALGELQPTEVEVLVPGEVRQILPDSSLIHSVVHLGLPSVTIVARTCAKAQAETEFAYFPPTVELDPARTSPQRTRRTQLLAMLVRSGAAGLMDTTEALLRASDPHTGFLAAAEFARSREGAARLPEVLALCEKQWPGTGEPFAAALTTDMRRKRAVQLLSRERDTECRLLLASLAALDDRRWIDTALRCAAPDTTADALIQRCVRSWGERDVLRAPDQDGSPYDNPVLRPLASLQRTPLRSQQVPA